MDLSGIRSVYFLGIGGIGMSALARYFVRLGAQVSGYDKTPTPLTDELIREGMEIHFEENPGLIPNWVDLVVWTPAVPPDHAEYTYLSRKGFPIRKRAEVLGEISAPFKTIAVAGTHGKTTTSTLIAHLFHTAGKEFLAFLGGISKNYGTNFIQSPVISHPSPVISHPSSVTSHPSSVIRHPSSVCCIVEADEYDRSFLQLTPDIAIITSADPDHLDIYNHHDQLKRSFEEFTGNIRQGGSLILKAGVNITPTRHFQYTTFSYSMNAEANFFAKNIFIREGLIHFDFVTPTEAIPGFVLGVPGMFNLENAVAALAAGYLAGIGAVALKEALQSFLGVQRRFDVQIRRSDLVYIDDYAHHPEELKACIRAVRELFPGKRLTGIFQPHLYSRTRDLADDFARVLGELDSLILLEIYPAREQPIEGVTSEFLLQKVPIENKTICSKTGLIDLLKREQPEILLTLGAGDIDQLVKPITEAFS
ncbi:MAG: Mur ligase family protein [bacterium]